MPMHTQWHNKEFELQKRWILNSCADLNMPQLNLIGQFLTFCKYKLVVRCSISTASDPIIFLFLMMRATMHFHSMNWIMTGPRSRYNSYGTLGLINCYSRLYARMQVYLCFWCTHLYACQWVIHIILEWHIQIVADTCPVTANFAINRNIYYPRKILGHAYFTVTPI